MRGSDVIEEEYRWIPGHEGGYQVSNLGNIISYKYSSPRVLHPTANSCGYLQVPLRKNGKIKRMYVHRLVAMLFVPGFAEDKEVNHKDYDKTNNTYLNLEWVTKSENHKHIISHKPEKCPFYKGDRKKVKRCVDCGVEIDLKAIRCKKCSNAYKRKDWPTPEQLKDDLLVLNFCEIGRKYNCSDSNIRKICRAYGLPTNTNGVNLLKTGP